MRSQWKIPHSLIVLEKKKNFLYESLPRNLLISTILLNRRVKIYNGKKYLFLRIKKTMLGFKLGEFCVTKALGYTIHKKKKKKKSSRKK